MFTSVHRAAAIERAEVNLTASIGQALLARGERGVIVERIGSGIAVMVRPGSPANKMIGVGFGSLPAADALAKIERAFSERQVPLQAEVSTLADAPLAAALTSRGYVLERFENVSGRAVTASDADVPVPGEIEIARMTPTDAQAFVEASVSAFSHPDDRGVPGEPLPSSDVLEHVLADFIDAPGFDRFIARIDGHMAGVATLRLDADVAQMCGAGTVPAFRRRGVQTALLRHRLGLAARSGCAMAVLTTSPGSTSEENGSRQGFSLLYSRAILVKHP